MLCERDVFSVSVWLEALRSVLVVPRSRPSFSSSSSSPLSLSSLVRNTHFTPQVSYPPSLALAFALVLAMSAPSSRSASPKPVSSPPPEAGEPVLPLVPASAVPLAASLPSPQFPSEVVVRPYAPRIRHGTNGDKGGVSGEVAYTGLLVGVWP